MGACARVHTKSCFEKFIMTTLRFIPLTTKALILHVSNMCSPPSLPASLTDSVNNNIKEQYKKAEHPNKKEHQSPYMTRDVLYRVRLFASKIHTVAIHQET